MEALFNTNAFVVAAASERAGTVPKPGNDQHVYLYGGPTSDQTLAVGTTDAVMRLIGALADDGQECLIWAR